MGRGPLSGRSGGEAVQENDASARGTIAGAALKPASAVAVTARVLRDWCNSLETDLIVGARRPDLLASIQDMQVAIEFICLATMDSVRLAPRSAAGVAVARRALWLKPWAADSQSKAKLLSLPFQGDYLFGQKLDDIIARSSGGKLAWLPQDRPSRGQAESTFPGIQGG